MSKYIRRPDIPLYTEMPKPKDKDIFIFGSKETKKDSSDTFSLAMNRYIEDLKITPEQAAVVIGIGRSSLYNYLADTREVTYSVMCAICIGLRLHPDRQRHIFHLYHIEKPDREYSTDPRDLLIIDYLDECAFDHSYSLAACNKELIGKGFKRLSSIVCDKKGGR